jgi:hypothetical protein
VSLPAFTADASLYRSRTTWRAPYGGYGAAAAQITPAWSEHDDRACSDCLESCAEALGWCIAGVGATAIFCPPCAAAALAGCDTTSVSCIAYCHLPTRACCPTFCRPGKCCGHGENCVADDDPQASHGCCPAGVPVCGDDCCSPGDFCCGDTCCPSGWFCQHGSCVQYPGFGTSTPPPPPPPPPDAAHVCDAVPGGEPCFNSQRWICCPPGLECCGPRGCRVSCVS